MLARITGTIIKILDSTIIVDIGPVALEVEVTRQDQSKIDLDSKMTLWTYLDVAETRLRLFGFVEFAQREMFKLLISVSGIGPKIALAILGGTSIDEVKNAVLDSDPGVFLSVSGIGARNAGRIVLELQNKLDDIDPEVVAKTKLNFSETQTIYEALASLGYRKDEVRGVLSEIEKDLTVEEKIQEILKALVKP